MPQLTLDKFGRIVIPKAVRENYGLQAGDRLELEEEDLGIMLKPVEDESALKEVNGVLVFTGELLGEAEEFVAKSRQERLRKLGGWDAQ